MGDEIQFEELLALVRRGNADAAETLVKRFETAIRVAVRTRLSDPALRRQFDSIDICQSVLASFFIRAAAGQYDLHDPKQLVALLTEFDRRMTGQLGVTATRIYTDATGVMFTVQHESEYADLQAFAASQANEAEMFASQEFRDFFTRMVPLVEKGERQLLNMTVVS